MNIIGYLHGRDPAACLVANGELVAFVEEERLIRQKHAANIFPIRSIDFCLKAGGLDLKDVDAFAFGYDAPSFSNGKIASIYDRINAHYPPDATTRNWQLANLSGHSVEAFTSRLDREILRYYGVANPAPLRFFPHHHSHAITAFHFSPFEDALVLIVDGSGDYQCTTLWEGRGAELKLLHEVEIPHSLGWFYAAVTEFLGFESYDGEYKVMGLAAYGRPNPRFREAFEQVLHPDSTPFGYALEGQYIHNGKRTHSGRFTDALVELLGMAPRARTEPLTAIHEDIAFEAQRALEEAVLRLVRHFRTVTGSKRLVLAGGVAQNVKMNGRIHAEGLFDEIFAFPIPSDSGTSIGAALGVHGEETGSIPRSPLKHLYLGPSYTDREIEDELNACGIAFERPDDLVAATAAKLEAGCLVGWFQGALEGGARALGARSILADPRTVETRDRVNAAVKFREYWRPFCPSLPIEDLDRFVNRGSEAPFMIMAFEATEEASARIPAVVHVDNTMRIQTVSREQNPLYHSLLVEFGRRTGAPALLNTSFNVKGEPIVCSPKDAIRTFFSTGLHVLVIGPYIVTKPGYTEQGQA